MKVVVSVQAKQGSSRGLVHYVAHSKTDEQREPPTREVFSEHADEITVEKANAFLRNGTTKTRATAEDLHHLVISLKPEDYERLGADEQERQASFKEIARGAMKRLAEAVGAERLAWAAGVHRNTDNPHVHIALSKEFFDRRGEKKVLSKIPPSCLPHYEKSETGEKVFASGVLIESAEEKLERIISDKSKDRNEPKQNHERTENEKRKFESESWRKNSPTGAKIRQTETKDETNFSNNEREILARAILAKFYLDATKENLESLTEQGAFRRFLIDDEISERKRRLSLFDLERRAEKNAQRELKKLQITDPAKRDEISKTLAASEIEKNSDAVKRIKTILHNLITKENQNLRYREKDYDRIKPQAEKIRRRYAGENKKLPAPNLTESEIEMLQTRSVEKGDVRASNYFERVRCELARERGTSTRNHEEIERLKPLLIVSELKAKSLEKQLKNLTDRKRFFPVEIDGEKWSLGKADALIAKNVENKNRFTGKISKVLGKIGIVETKNARVELEEIRVKIAHKLGEKIETLASELEREKSIGKMLHEFYASDTNSEKENLKAKFTGAQLAEIESLAFELKLSGVYRENFAAQKQFIERGAGDDKFGAKSIGGESEKTIAGRAVARAVLCEMETARAKEELADFQKNKRFQKFEIADEKTGASRFVSLKEVEFNARGSILDQTLEFFTESFEKRRTRRQLEKSVKEKSAELKENLRAARAMEKSAAADAENYLHKSFFGAIRFSHPPVFTPKETVTIELRIRQTENKSEASKLRKVFGAAEHSKSKNLTAILSEYQTENYHKIVERGEVQRGEPSVSQTVIKTGATVETSGAAQPDETEHILQLPTKRDAEGAENHNREISR